MAIPKKISELPPAPVTAPRGAPGAPNAKMREAATKGYAPTDSESSEQPTDDNPAKPMRLSMTSHGKRVIQSIVDAHKARMVQRAVRDLRIPEPKTEAETQEAIELYQKWRRIMRRAEQAPETSRTSNPSEK